MSVPIRAAESGPQAATQTVTVTVNSTTPQPLFRLYYGYFRSLHGWINLLEVVLCLLALICIASVGYLFSILPMINFLYFVAISGMLFSCIFIFAFYSSVFTIFPLIPWIKIELLYSVLWFFFCLVAGIVAASNAYLFSPGIAAAAFFFFLATCVFGFWAFRLFLLDRQGVRVAFAQTTVTSISHSTTVSPN